MEETEDAKQPGEPSRMRRLLHWLGTWSLLQWGVVLLAGFITLVALLYVEENWRGKRAWDRYKSEMGAQGKVLDWNAYIPPSVPMDENVFMAPNMSAWFVKRSGSLGAPMNLNGMSPYNQEEHGNAMAEITIVPLDAEIAPQEGDLVLTYRPPVLASALVETNAPRRTQITNEIIPLIVMNEVPLSDAIKNLARVAVTNYAIDPNLQSEHNQDGSLFLETKVSFKWTNITARAALEAMLDNHNLQLVDDPKTLLARIIKKNVQPTAEPDVRERLKKIAFAEIESDTNAPDGPSLTATLGFTLHLNPVKHGKPVRIIVKAKDIPRTDEIAAFFPGNMRVPGVSTFSNPRAKSTGSNTFKVWVSPGNHVSAADYLAWSDQFAPEFEMIREGLKRPYARMEGSYEMPSEMPIPNFIAVRMLAQTLSQRAQCYLLLGKSDEALRELTLVHDLCRILEGRPKNTAMTLVAAMINVAIRGLYVSVVADGLRLQAWKEPQLVALQTQLAEVDLLPDVAAALETERVVSCHLLEHTSPEQYDKLYSGTFSSSMSLKDKFKDPMFVFLIFAPRGWIYQNMVAMGKMNGDMMRTIDVTNHLVRAQGAEAWLQEMEVATARVSSKTFLAARFVPNYGKALRTAARNQTLVNEAQMVCALERYQLAHGAYPEKLEALMPQFILAIPHDIIGGAPLKYRAEKDQFLLYSVGWNEKDDGGLAVTNKAGMVELEKGDWVWPYRQKL